MIINGLKIYQIGSFFLNLPIELKPSLASTTGTATLLEGLIPIMYQWFKRFTIGFSPACSNIVSCVFCSVVQVCRSLHNTAVLSDFCLLADNGAWLGWCYWVSESVRRVGGHRRGQRRGGDLIGATHECVMLLFSVIISRIFFHNSYIRSNELGPCYHGTS